VVAGEYTITVLYCTVLCFTYLITLGALLSLIVRGSLIIIILHDNIIVL
jgi:hypothetical protein